MKNDFQQIFIQQQCIYLVDVPITGHSIEMLSKMLERLEVMLGKFVNESLQL